MTKIVCSKCGATGYSKNPYCRSVFPDSMTASVASWVLEVTLAQDENVKTLNRLSVQYLCSHETAEEALSALENLLSLLKEEPGGVAQFLCDHSWVMAEGETHWDVDY